LGGSERTVAISAPAFGGSPSGASQSLGTLACIQGSLAGQRFEIRPEGVYIGRDATLSQIVVADARVSKRHVWIGPRNGRIAVVDQQSTNGTYLNVPNSQRVTEASLNPGDTVILSEADVARFQFVR
jgi:pSer/pThr/pTyr-binding forkhead associated (FHA) protein